MKRTIRTEEQIIGILQEHEAGAKCADLCRKHGMSEGTCLSLEGEVFRDDGIGGQAAEGAARPRGRPALPPPPVGLCLWLLSPFAFGHPVFGVWASMPFDIVGPVTGAVASLLLLLALSARRFQAAALTIYHDPAPPGGWHLGPECLGDHRAHCRVVPVIWSRAEAAMLALPLAMILIAAMGGLSGLRLNRSPSVAGTVFVIKDGPALAIGDYVSFCLPRTRAEVPQMARATVKLCLKDQPGTPILKRIAAIDSRGRLFLLGTHPASLDSRTFGWIEPAAVQHRLKRIW